MPRNSISSLSDVLDKAFAGGSNTYSLFERVDENNAHENPDGLEGERYASHIDTGFNTTDSSDPSSNRYMVVPDMTPSFSRRSVDSEHLNFATTFSEPSTQIVYDTGVEIVPRHSTEITDSPLLSRDLLAAAEQPSKTSSQLFGLKLPWSKSKAGDLFKHWVNKEELFGEDKKSKEDKDSPYSFVNRNVKQSGGMEDWEPGFIDDEPRVSVTGSSRGSQSSFLPPFDIQSQLNPQIFADDTLSTSGSASGARMSRVSLGDNLTVPNGLVVSGDLGFTTSLMSLVSRGPLPSGSSTDFVPYDTVTDAREVFPVEYDIISAEQSGLSVTTDAGHYSTYVQSKTASDGDGDNVSNIYSTYIKTAGSRSDAGSESAYDMAPTPNGPSPAGETAEPPARISLVSDAVLVIEPDSIQGADRRSSMLSGNDLWEDDQNQSDNDEGIKTGSVAADEDPYAIFSKSNKSHDRFSALASDDGGGRYESKTVVPINILSSTNGGIREDIAALEDEVLFSDDENLDFATAASASNAQHDWNTANMQSVKAIPKSQAKSQRLKSTVQLQANGQEDSDKEDYSFVHASTNLHKQKIANTKSVQVIGASQATSGHLPSSVVKSNSASNVSMDAENPYVMLDFSTMKLQNSPCQSSQVAEIHTAKSIPSQTAYTAAPQLFGVFEDDDQDDKGESAWKTEGVPVNLFRRLSSFRRGDNN